MTGIAFKGVREIRKQSREIISTEGFVTCLVFAALGFAAFAYTNHVAFLIAGAAIGVYMLLAIKVADQWEKAAVLRLGRFRGMRGPGIFFVIPVIEKISRYVDQRIRVTDVAAETALTRD